ncbi:MAG: MATE family efflux transporter [Candidatus Bathyarchaeia archaeon]|nr:MATE family efflux transporter [Candidatus Bathyarchaeota archaeon]
MANAESEAGEIISIGRYREKIVHGPIIRTLLWLGAPPLLNQLVIIAYNTADAYWLSQYNDTLVAVPRQMWPIYMLFNAFAMALTAASLSMVSQYIGGKMFNEASRSASRFFTVSSFLGALLCTVLLIFKEKIFMQLLATPPEIFNEVIKYSTIIAFDILFGYTSLIFTALLQSVGETRRPAIINSILVSLNMLFDPFLILGIGPFPRLGVIGAALTDVMGKFISTILLAYVLKRYYPGFNVVFTRDIDLEWVLLVARVGLPVLVLGLANSFAFVAQLRIVNDLGIVAATSYAIGFVIMDIVDGALFGLTSAVSIMIGQSLGAADLKRAKEISYKACLLIFFFVTLGVIAIYPVKETLIRAFSDDPIIFAETNLFLETLLPTLPFFSLFMVVISVGRGSGHTLTPTLIGMFRLWGIRVILGYVLAFVFSMGSWGAWLAIALSNAIGGVFAVLWIKYGRWAKPIIGVVEQK